MTGTDTIEGAQRAIQHVLGSVIGTIFSIGLLASSLSSTSVGTYAGSEIMHGLLRIKAPMWACRVVTLVPALVVLWFANNPTEALIVGQVVLSVGIPFAIIPLMRYTHDRTLMGSTWTARQARRQYRGRGADRRSERGADCADNARQSLIFRDFYVDLRRICGAFFVVSQLIF